MGNSHGAFFGGVLEIDVSNLQDSLPVASVLGVGDPNRRLGVVWLGLVGLLHVHAGEQELRGVGVHCALDELDMAGHLGSELPLCAQVVNETDDCTRLPM